MFIVVELYGCCVRVFVVVCIDQFALGHFYGFKTHTIVCVVLYSIRIHTVLGYIQ